MSSPLLSVRLVRAAFSFDDVRLLLQDADLQLTAGWTGIVGPNGAGKSTLLSLLAGILPLREGRVLFTPERPLIRLCPQRVDALSDDLRRVAEDPPPHAHRILGELGLWEGQLQRWSTLSPGERKRWQVAAALAAEPDVLLLDEPTNHLDAEATGWLGRALSRFRGIGVLVSHDRALLDGLTTRTVELDGEGGLREFPGPYGAARAAWEAEREQRAQERAEARAAHRKAQRSLQEARQTRASAESSRSVATRMKDKYDSDARTLGADFRAEQAEKRLAKSQAAAKRTESRAADAVATLHVDKPLGAELFADWVPSPRPVLLRLERDALFAGEGPEAVRIIEGPLRHYVGRTDRIHLAGPNGAGKTTLLRALLGNEAPASDEGPGSSGILHLPQDLSDREVSAAVARLHALPRDARGRVLCFVAALGVEPEHLLATARPSPGEARKLVLAEAMAGGVHALVLDEPTNHLDLPSVERLEALLRQWPGALVLVTHDAQLASATCTVRWEVNSSGIRTCT